MGKLQKNQNGFSAAETVLVLIIVALVGFVGWYVWRTKQDTDKTSVSEKTAPASKPAAKKQPDSYEGWKEYCDTKVVACFKYPSDWNLEYGDSINTQLNSPDAKLSYFDNADMQYPTGVYAVQMGLGDANSAYGTSGSSDFHVVSIKNVPNSSQLKVVGGYSIDSDIAGYYITDNDFISKYSLQIGKEATAVPNITYTEKTVSKAFFANDARSEGQSTIEKANDWFTTSYAKDALLILQSYSAQN